MYHVPCDSTNLIYVIIQVEKTFKEMYVENEWTNFKKYLESRTTCQKKHQCFVGSQSKIS